MNLKLSSVFHLQLALGQCNDSNYLTLSDITLLLILFFLGLVVYLSVCWQLRFDNSNTECCPWSFSLVLLVVSQIIWCFVVLLLKCYTSRRTSGKILGLKKTGNLGSLMCVLKLLLYLTVHIVNCRVKKDGVSIRVVINEYR